MKFLDTLTKQQLHHVWLLADDEAGRGSRYYNTVPKIVCQCCLCRTNGMSSAWEPDYANKMAACDAYVRHLLQSHPLDIFT